MNKSKDKKEVGLSRIRQRKSYKMFKKWLQFLNRKPSRRTILKRLYEELDGRYAFGSERNSAFACESLELLASDEKLTKNDEVKP